MMMRRSILLIALIAVCAVPAQSEKTKPSAYVDMTVNGQKVHIESDKGLDITVGGDGIKVESGDPGLEADKLFAQGRQKEALPLYEKAARRHPTGEAFNNLASCQHELGLNRDCINNCNLGLKLNPQDCYLYSTRGSAYEALGQAAAAKADYQKAIELSKAKSKAAAPEERYGELVMWGDCYRGAGDFGSSLKCLDEAVKLFPKNYYAYEYRAKTLRASGDLAKAKTDERMVQLLKSRPSENSLGRVTGK